MDTSVAKIVSDRNLSFVARQMALHANVSSGCSLGRWWCGAPWWSSLWPYSVLSRWPHRYTTADPTPRTSIPPSGSQDSATLSVSVSG